MCLKISVSPGGPGTVLSNERSEYRERVDSAPLPSAGIKIPATAIPLPDSHVSEALAFILDHVWQESESERVDLQKSELALVLEAVGAKYNFGLAPEATATRQQMCSFWRALQLKDLALAQACALGRERAWQLFVTDYRQPLRQTAIGLTNSASLGEDLADSIYSEMFGLSVRDGHRRSPLASYAGRGSLMGFLRTVLSQRHVDHHRRTHRETSLEGKEFAARTQPAEAPAGLLRRVGDSLTLILKALGAEDRFLLSAWYLDQRTLLEIAQVCRVHESTVWRKLKRLTERVKKELVSSLQRSGMSKEAAEEVLCGTDPRDLTINLRSLLQSTQTGPFLQQETSSKQEPA